MALITFQDKDNTQPTSDARRLVRDVDLNEIKNVVNTNATTAIVENEVPTGSGTNFLLANIPVVGSVKLYRNGIRQSVPGDYSISGTNITLTSTIGSDTLLADYRK